MGECEQVKERSVEFVIQYPTLSAWLRRERASEDWLAQHVRQCTIVQDCLHVLWEMDKEARRHNGFTEGSVLDVRRGGRPRQVVRGIFSGTVQEGGSWYRCWRGDSWCIQCDGRRGTCL